MVATAKSISDFSHLETHTSTDVKTGWRRVMKDVRENGPVVILNHKEPEAIILSPEEYRKMKAVVDSVEQGNSNTLQELSRRFNQKLAILNSPDTVSKVNNLFSTDIETKRVTRPKAGRSF